MSEYCGEKFLGFSACAPKGLIPDWLYFSMHCPSVSVNDDGAVKYAPCGIRKVEAAILDHGFKRENVIVVHPEYLHKVIGTKTRGQWNHRNGPPRTSTHNFNIHVAV